MNALPLAALQGCPWCGHMGWGGWVATLLIWILVIALIVALILVFTRRPRGDDGAHRQDRAEDELRERYARGEIDEDTYRRRLDELRSR